MKDNRRFRRQTAPDGSIAISGTKPFRLLDYSEEGLGLRFYGEDEIGDDIGIVLLVPARALPGGELQCRKIYDVIQEPGGVFSFARDRRIGLQFMEPQPDLARVL